MVVLLATRGATLKIPHFTKGRKQLSAQEVDTSRHLSNVRIHIERVIGKITDSCYSTHTGRPLRGDGDCVCGALTNLCKCTVPRREHEVVNFVLIIIFLGGGGGNRTEKDQ